MSEREPDLGEAVDYILAERPKLWENEVWTVVMELQDPPAPGADKLAIAVVRERHPEISKRDVKQMLRERRACVTLARERHWDDEEIDT